MKTESTAQTVAQSELDGKKSSDTPRPFYIVGIGASAGGLEALEQFFENIPEQTGMAFVVVQHLSPDFKSMMDELLARKTPLPIHRVENGMEVKPDAVYLIPPKKDMIISNGRLLLTDKDPRQGMTLPIDHFFRSLAQDCGDRAVGIILSGTGSDGSRGLRDIHDAGGLVIAQTPESAKFDGMPNSARQTGECDLIIAPHEMPKALLNFTKHPLWLDSEQSSDPNVLSESRLDAIFRLLRNSYGIDFSHYKLSTVSRRIDRRLLLNRSVDLEEYVKKLDEDPEELNSLYKDLLIGVTRFFRDTDAFERMQNEILPQLLNELEPDEDFRVWVAGCATGEEAYSLAILIHECIEAMKRPVHVKIFATDVHRTSLEFAGAGVYSKQQVADVSARRLERYFINKSDGYHVSQELRQMVVFAPHNFIKDAPFTKLSLISCRNLLIYLQPAAQRKAISLFHFGLKTGGVLFLGPSESPGELSEEFATLVTHWKMYRKRRDIRLPSDLRLPLSPVIGGIEAPRASSRPSILADQQRLGIYDVLLDEYMPCSMLVNENHELVESFGGASRFLRMRDRRVSTDVLDLVDTELKIVLSGALPRIFTDKNSVVYKGLKLKTAEGERTVNVTVAPVVCKRSALRHALVTLEDLSSAQTAPAVASEIYLGSASQEQLSSLETELRYTKENLQATIEELEASNEELQATNEELLASNEELHSTNEELHSVNEELYTVNAEFQKKISELTEMSADMESLLDSTRVHILFLDRDLCIRKLTPRIAEHFNLLPQDLGRRIDNFTHNIEYPTLIEDIVRVMDTGEELETQVRDRLGHWYLMRILPYHSRTDSGGAVLTLIDLANLKKAEAKARTADEKLSNILRNSPHLVHLKDLQGRVILSDDAFKNAFGCDPVGKTLDDLFPEETATLLNKLDQRVQGLGENAEAEIRIATPAGPRTYLWIKFPMRDDKGKIIGVGGIATDVTRLKSAEQQAREALEQRDRFLAMLSHELRNPLGAIVNATSILNATPSEEEGCKHALEVIQRQSRQMTRILDDLLEISRIAKDKIILKKQPVRLREIVDDAIHVVKPALDKSELKLTTHRDESAVVLGDGARLQQMLVNLLNNAVKYTPPGGRVSVRMERDAGDALVRIKDNGVGIRPELLPKVFDLFVQADETLDRAKGGIGVGLTLARSISKLHGGSLSAASDGPGRGSEFIVRLPLAPSEEAVSPVPSSPRDVELSNKVLIVEDNDDSRASLEILLRLLGCDVCAARTGAEGLAMMLKEHPALALVDIGLPGLDGYEVARRARAQLGKDGTYMVALTGYGRPEDRLLVLEAGFDEHLIKPLQRNDLERLIHSPRLRAAVVGEGKSVHA